MNEPGATRHSLQELHDHMRSVFERICLCGKQGERDELKVEFGQAQVAYQAALATEQQRSLQAQAMTVHLPDQLPSVNILVHKLPTASTLALATLDKSEYALCLAWLKKSPRHLTRVRLKLEAQLKPGFTPDSQVVELGVEPVSFLLRPLPLPPPWPDGVRETDFSLSCARIYDPERGPQQYDGIPTGKVTLLPSQSCPRQVYSLSQKKWISATHSWLALVSPNGRRVRSLYRTLEMAAFEYQNQKPRRTFPLVEAAFATLFKDRSVSPGGPRSALRWQAGHEIQPLSPPDESLALPTISAPDATLALLSVLEMLHVPCGLALACGQLLAAWECQPSSEWKHLDLQHLTTTVWQPTPFSAAYNAGQHAAKAASELHCYQLHVLDEARVRGIYPLFD